MRKYNISANLIRVILYGIVYFPRMSPQNRLKPQAEKKIILLVLRERKSPSQSDMLQRSRLLNLDFKTTCCLLPSVSYAAVEEDCTSGLVTEVFDDSDKVGADVVLPHGCLQSCTPNPVEDLLEVFEDMVEALLVLEIFLTEEF